MLEPGDILYVPPGFAHDGVAVRDDCMTYSIGFRAPTGTTAFSEITAAGPSSSGRASPAWDVKIPLILRWARTARLDELREYSSRTNIVTGVNL